VDYKPSAFRRLNAIAQNTYREALRNRAFIALMLIALIFVLCSWLLGEMSVPGQRSRVILNFGFFAIGLFCVVTAIVMGAVLLHKEVEKKTIYTILSKPVHRHEFLLGKYLGMLAIVAVEMLVLSLVWLLIYGASGGDISWSIFAGIALMYLEVMLVTGVALMFSAMSTPILTAIFTGGIFAVGRYHSTLQEMLNAKRGVLVDNEAARVFGESAVAVFPDLSVFNISQQVLWGVDVGWAYLGQALLYGLGYTVIFLGIGILVFQRRDFV
jgi:ABC-type transport system involved in multi-copper enzyme maturation permease subunit